jgi:arylsulfatase
MLGSRAIWSDGWTAVAWHRKDAPFQDDRWELYHSDADFSQAHDLAGERPDKLRDLVALWQAEAEKFAVLPLDDRRYERVADPSRPVAAESKPVYVYYPGTSVVHPLAAPQLLGRAHRITAYVVIPEVGAEGVLAASGGEFGGWSLFVQDGRLHYVHNYLKLHEYEVTSSAELTPGRHELAVSFTPTGASLKPDIFTGDIALFVDGQQVGALAGIKMAGQYSAVTGYGLLIGRNTGTPVSPSYRPPFAFTGTLDRVAIELPHAKQEAVQ